jgi:hypothetical protein
VARGKVTADVTLTTRMRILGADGRA